MMVPSSVKISRLDFNRKLLELVKSGTKDGKCLKVVDRRTCRLIIFFNWFIGSIMSMALYFTLKYHSISIHLLLLFSEN